MVLMEMDLRADNDDNDKEQKLIDEHSHLIEFDVFE